MGGAGFTEAKPRQADNSRGGVPLGAIDSMLVRRGIGCDFLPQPGAYRGDRDR